MRSLQIGVSERKEESIRNFGGTLGFVMNLQKINGNRNEKKRSWATHASILGLSPFLPSEVVFSTNRSRERIFEVEDQMVRVPTQAEDCK